VVAAAGRPIPRYSVNDRTGGQRNVTAMPANRSGHEHEIGILAAALQNCGVSHEQLKGLIDLYVLDGKTNHKSRKDTALPRTQGAVPQANQQDFRQPALPTPGVVTLAHGGQEYTPVVMSRAMASTQAAALPSVSCLSCGRRGHYSTSGPYPPLPPQEQEYLQESAKMARLQRAGLLVNRRSTMNVHVTQPCDTVTDTGEGTD
jgi:cytochrome c553